MKIQHFRNATMVIQTKGHVVLIDPMLGSKGSMPPFTFFRFKPKRNPIVDLPESCRSILDQVTHCVITHNHPDHLDKEAIKFLVSKKIPITCSKLDQSTFRKKGLNVVQTLEYWKRTDFLGGKIEGIPARHGYGFIAKPAGNVMGFYIELPNESSIYLSSDTIYTDDVKRVLTKYKPEISVIAAGSAQFDIFKPLLMTINDIIAFIKDAPGNVIANHLEAVNHCPTSRKDLQNKLHSSGLNKKVWIPEDGDIANY